MSASNAVKDLMVFSRIGKYHGNDCLQEYNALFGASYSWFEKINVFLVVLPEI